MPFDWTKLPGHPVMGLSQAMVQPVVRIDDNQDGNNNVLLASSPNVISKSRSAGADARADIGVACTH